MLQAMDEHWEEHAKIWDADEDARFFADRALASLLEHVDLHGDAWKQRRVLDFGCGTGLLTERLAPLVKEVVAVDISPAMLDVLRNKQLDNVEVYCANIDDAAVRSAASWLAEFDLIVASSVCAFLPNYASTVGALARALNPGSFFVQWDWLLPEEDDDDDGLTLANVESAFSNAGLAGVHVGRAFDVLFDADETPVLIGVANKTAAK
jgi:predicted TPR repeat methyltransferase